MAPKMKRAIRKIKSSRVSSIVTTASLNLVDKEHPIPFDVPAKCHRRASLDPDQEKSMIREVDLRRLRDVYFILDSIRLTVPGPDD